MLRNTFLLNVRHLDVFHKIFAMPCYFSTQYSLGRFDPYRWEPPLHGPWGPSLGGPAFMVNGGNGA